MTPENFHEILVLIRDDITKKDTPMREPIPPEIKLAVTIRFLATGTTFDNLSMCFRVHKSTIGKFVPEVCEAIYRRLKIDYFQVKFILITNYISFDCKYLTKLRGIFSVAAMSADLGCSRGVHVARYSKVRRYAVRRHMDRKSCRLLHI